jgi:ribosomal protein S18 acetylase RimI-like enzyme
MQTIREAIQKDIPLIRELTYKVWPQTYVSMLSKEQIDYMLTLMYSQESLEKQMKEGSQFFIVSDNDEPVGFASIKQTDSSSFKLDKIYILQSQQGKGTGRCVLDHIIREIQKKGATTFWLQVKRDNPARSFYEKNGFVVTREADFDIGNGYFMRDFIMEKNI